MNRKKSIAKCVELMSFYEQGSIDYKCLDRLLDDLLKREFNERIKGETKTSRSNAPIKRHCWKQAYSRYGSNGIWEDNIS